VRTQFSQVRPQANIYRREVNKFLGENIPKTIVKALVDSARVLDSAGFSLDPESTKSFLDFTSAVVGKNLDVEMAYSLVTCAITTMGGVERTFTLNTDLVLGVEIDVKSYQCYMNSTIVPI